ncbi:MAG: Uma2 family endonuclease [Ilumatobacteraceae bacterium]
MPLVDPTAIDDVIYPESDDQPMAENFLQSIVIRTIVTGFERLYADRPDIIVGGDFFWYPVKGSPTTVVAADAMVIVEVPHPVDIFTIGSYRQWEHGGHPALAVEVLSPSNSWAEMARKRRFYHHHGVDEYWVFDPFDGTLEVWLRDGDRFTEVDDPASGWISPTTGVHVTVVDSELVLHDPDGVRRWLTPAQEAARADTEAARADTEAARAEALVAQVAALQARLDSEPAS